VTELGGWHKVLNYCYIIRLKSLAPISGLTRLLASQKTVLLLIESKDHH